MIQYKFLILVPIMKVRSSFLGIMMNPTKSDLTKKVAIVRLGIFCFLIKDLFIYYNDETIVHDRISHFFIEIVHNTIILTQTLTTLVVLHAYKISSN